MATADLFKNLTWKNSLAAQKAKIKWIKEGDINTSFFSQGGKSKKEG